jgi:uncharacterized protein YkwD
MPRSTVVLDAWPWIFRLWVALALFLVLRPPLLMLWHYGLFPPSSSQGEEQPPPPMRLPAVPGMLSQPLPASAPRPLEILALERDILAGTNRMRAEVSGLPPLRGNDELSEVAARHSARMRDAKFFAHASPDGAGPSDRAGQAMRQSFGTVGENIAKITRQPQLAERFVEGWMNSPGHRANILNTAYTDLGVGCAPPTPDDASAWVHCTQLFMATAARVRQPLPDAARAGQILDLAIDAENGGRLPVRLRQVLLQTGAARKSFDLREQSGTAAGKLTVQGPPGVYRLEAEIPDAQDSRRFWIVPGPYLSVQP